ncbi:ATP-binding cassette domain-containing protein [Plantibacter sp. VKM Ac-2880]|uniref:ATP-binding cassette domain-containing protein n=1 Tax=Plantibacter sp. VKM Ac-2880 TaxID=2783827 RepID=UPI00188E5453|nr:ATP-binding cassette domain-containing protein [Plantibacter sp. VKM Ac-2880]MBF4569042.1 ATP-binding cassette domain-containing protein [Plantibacter sp. VKM Ac-2880]
MKHPEQDGPAVRTSDLSVDYAAHGVSPSNRALDGISFELPVGGSLGVIGSSGSGKSTLLWVLSGRHLTGGDSRPFVSGGDATTLGRSMRKVGRRELTKLTFEVSLLEQEAGAHLKPELTVTELISEPVLARDKKFSEQALGVRVATLLDAVQMPLSSLDKYPYELSGGQRQRIAIARALVLGPRLFIADEPTAGIDITVRHTVTELLNGFRQDGGTVIVVTHDLAMLRELTDDVLALHQSRVVGYGPIDALLADPPHDFLAALAQSGGTETQYETPEAVGID